MKNLRFHNELFKTSGKESDQRERYPRKRKPQGEMESVILEVCFHGGPGARVP